MGLYYQNRAAYRRLMDAWTQALAVAGLPASAADWTPTQRDQAHALRLEIARKLSNNGKDIVITDDVPRQRSRRVQPPSTSQSAMIAQPYHPEQPQTAGPVVWTQGSACPVCRRAVADWDYFAHPAPQTGADPLQIRIGGVAGAVLLPCGHAVQVVLPPAGTAPG